MKKFLILLFLFSSAFADSNASAPTKNKSKFLNNPAVANSRQAGSNQTFGNQKISGQKGQKYYTTKQMDKPLNNPVVANSRQAGSSQTFGEPPITGTKGKSYHQKKSSEQNRPAVGSKQSSDFIFDQDQNPVTKKSLNNN